MLFFVVVLLVVVLRGDRGTAPGKGQEPGPSSWQETRFKFEGHGKGVVLCGGPMMVAMVAPSG